MRELERKVLRNCLGFDVRAKVFQATLRLSFYNKLWSGTVCLFMQKYPFVFISNVV